MKTQDRIFISLISISLILTATQAANATSESHALFLTCGSSNGGKDAEGRVWEPDSKYLVNDKKSIMEKAETQDPSLPSDIPYMTARIFQSEATYQIPLQNSSSRTLLRLHFYPCSYPNFNISNSYFSVKAGGITLLQNFSTFITAEAFSQAYFIKEYYLIPSNFSTLNITFKPSNEQNHNFAFINGIEVISAPEIFNENPLLPGLSGSDTNDVAEEEVAKTTLPIDTASMETMFRLNVGGQFINPTNDSDGLMRSWYDDTPYIYTANTGVLQTAKVPIDLRDMPTYMAPLDVYKTCRAMGDLPEINKKSNLTWVFQVDPNFMYMVRFHWCDSDMIRTNQRVFDVLLNNKTTFDGLDLYGLTQAKGIAVKKDFAVYVNKQMNDEAQLWVSLRPSLKTTPQYYDAILNGLEIFKISNEANSSLAGPNPTISDLMRKYKESIEVAPNPVEMAKKSSSSFTVLITGAAGGAAAFGMAAVLFIVAFKKKNRVPGAEIGSSWLPISWTSISSTGKSMSGGSQVISADAACNCRYFSLSEIKNATKNFDESNVIGVGGFGKVYKGIIDDGTKVAVKRSNPSSEQGVNEFQTEIEMLSKLRHRHLVSLIGFCEDNGEMILVYDYMGKGTLREHLYKGNKTTLSWKQRLEICIGAARGLHYLHTGAKYTIIHRDVKTTNILLDDNFVAKVSDFGLSKTGPNMNKGHVSTVVKGSFGYLDPEYFRRQHLTEKSDVYSFGVVLFEVLSARPALNPSLPKEQVSLAEWALRCARNETLQLVIDPQLKGNITPECLKKFAETAEKCLSDHGAERPTMGDVLWNLEFALQLQENPESCRILDSTGNHVEEEIDQFNLLAMHRNTLNLDEEEDEGKDPKADGASEDIFSQIVNPKGR